MKQGLKMSEPAKQLLADSENDLNAAIAKFLKFAETMSSATAKYRVATLTQDTKNVIKDLNKLLKEAE